MPKQQLNRSTESVRRRFNDPDHYLYNNFEIISRAGILRTMLPSAEGLTILDVGCGDGSLSLQFLAEAKHVTLVDLSKGMLLRAEAKIPPALFHKVTIANADLMQFVPAEPADVVICVGVLAHVERLEPAIRKLVSMTKVGGRCVVQITDHDRAVGRIQSAFSRGTYPLLSISGFELQQIASAAGFRNCQRANHYLLLPGMGRLPGRWLLTYDSFVLNCPLLSRVAPSAILMFER
jgi:ubiquinone/menaquinone biosynthesis C-methylase UbiE